ncbi:DUF1592 domain-containing protein [Neorhodopirellula pilleata]|uniref:Planctomycete cytochrome C n=1 Tax=Neorhodopirellula pilleata TaxID=2714738 RepID=A0A5C6AW87_9BACT|nr:DUF1592 domain-containing protein [Neorhodopirellula pilleata]TWU03767.1 Planctomycete cytochrome C [Neorhodopirellula pilleata]
MKWLFQRTRPLPPTLFVAVMILAGWIAPVCPVMAESEEFQPDQTGFDRDAFPLLTTFCLDCHGPDTQEGEFRVDRLSEQMTDRANASRWAEVVNVLNSHEMPPEDSRQPSPELVAILVDWVTGEMKRAEKFNRSADVVLRRLNRAEYKNTIRDLIGVEFDVSAFPEDASAGGFDNNGGALSVSPMQIETYLQSAREILDKAIVTGERPESIRWRFEPESGDSDGNRVKYGDNNAIVNGGQNPVYGNGRLIAFDRWNKSINARDFRVPTPGPYVVRIHAGGLVPTREDVVKMATRFHQELFDNRMREKPQDERHHRHNMDREIEHMKVSSIYNYGPPRVRVTVHQGGQPTIIGEADVTGGIDDGNLQTLEFPGEMGTEKSGITLQNSYTLRRILENITVHGQDDFPRPSLLVDWFELEGPVYPVWPPQSHTRLLPKPIPESANEQREYAKEVLTRFMPAAYRRPVESAEVAEKLSLYDMAWKQTEDFIESIKIALTSVLVSPNFLYLAEPEDESELTDFELASRLSYFLWSTMPDDELLSLAQDGRLSDPKTRAAQVDRMLADPRSVSLAENFAAQWLGLREIGANPPAEDLFPRYDDHLEESLARESKAFFMEVLLNDLSISTFIDSDFAMLNERLARFYNIEGVRGDKVRRVSIDPSTHRGGLLTQASILTTTSNGTRTTPVKRGTWILKTLLNADPGLPVANAGEISPKVPGLDKATVRQRLEIHRELPQCARCHDKIDPLGFALENFDASGQWREREGFGYKGRVGDNDPLIDATGRLPDGTEIDGIDGLKEALLARREQLHEALATKLFSYALGREMTLVDREDIRRATMLTQTHRPDLRTLIKAIVMSQSFLQR